MGRLGGGSVRIGRQIGSESENEDEIESKRMASGCLLGASVGEIWENENGDRNDGRGDTFELFPPPPPSITDIELFSPFLSHMQISQICDEWLESLSSPT